MMALWRKQPRAVHGLSFATGASLATFHVRRGRLNLAAVGAAWCYHGSTVTSKVLWCTMCGGLVCSACRFWYCVKYTYVQWYSVMCCSCSLWGKYRSPGSCGWAPALVGQIPVVGVQWRCNVRCRAKRHQNCSEMGQTMDCGGHGPSRTKKKRGQGWGLTFRLTVMRTPPLCSWIFVSEPQVGSQTTRGCISTTSSILVSSILTSWALAAVQHGSPGLVGRVYWALDRASMSPCSYITSCTRPPALMPPPHVRTKRTHFRYLVPAFPHPSQPGHRPSLLRISSRACCSNKGNRAPSTYRSGLPLLPLVGPGARVLASSSWAVQEVRKDRTRRPPDRSCKSSPPCQVACMPPTTTLT